MLNTTTSPRTVPIRAIPSALANRNVPSVPPSSQLYDPPAKSILRHRLIHGIFLHSALYSWIAATVWSTWHRGGLSHIGITRTLLSPLSPSALIAACAIWAFGPLPVVILRKMYIITSTSTASSPSKKLQAALAKPSTLKCFLCYALSSILITCVHAVMAQTYEPGTSSDPRLALFVKSRKHPYYLNGRLLFLFSAQVLLACSAALRNVMLDRFAVRPSSVRVQVSKRPFSFIDVIKTLTIASLLSSIVLPIAVVSFGLLRVFVLPVLFKVPFVSMFLKPFTAHFLRRGSYTIFLPWRHAWLICRAWFLMVTTYSVWDFTEMLFDAYVSQPVNVGHASADPMLTLVSGALSPDQSFKQHALLELTHLAEQQSPAARARRSAFFADQKYSPSLWSTLLKEGLLTLGKDYQLFLRRGVPPAPPAPQAAPAPKQPTADPFPSTPKKLIQKPIFQASRQSPIRGAIDALASDGPLAQAVDAGADAAHIPELFRSVAGAVGSPKPVAAAKEEAKKVADVGKGLVSRARAGLGANVYGAVSAYAPRSVNVAVEGWRTWWTKDRLGKVAEGCLPNRDLDVLIIEVLSHLTCASLTEDQYGVVQRDIPKILEAFLSFLSAIEEYQVELNALYTPPHPDKRLTIQELEESETLRAEVAAASDVLSVVGDALKDGVARIVRTFGDKLFAFKFPARTGAKLQGFMDYC
ncbi:hypothetical protein HGRIS_014363 [Hohenbuehelia grisea]|uniref:Nucleoporin NDC1 n=1 Tax=Hohenbuehelia grisea TaxID=104357 RepID=A0ABR3JUY1_9AGAR